VQSMLRPMTDVVMVTFFFPFRSDEGGWCEQRLRYQCGADKPAP
jgi:hypothetical protein